MRLLAAVRLRVLAHVRRSLLDLLRTDLSPADVRMLHPVAFHAIVADAFEAGRLVGDTQGRQAERVRIKGVYEIAMMKLDPLVERLMFDGVTPPEGAALAWVATVRADAEIRAEVARRGIGDCRLN